MSLFDKIIKKEKHSLLLHHLIKLTKISCSKPSDRRKIEEEYCVFSEEWIKWYFFVKVGAKAACLICHETETEFKECNLRCYCQMKHVNFEYNLSKQELQKKANVLSSRLKQQQNVLMQLHLFKGSRQRQVLYWRAKQAIHRSRI